MNILEKIATWANIISFALSILGIGAMLGFMSLPKLSLPFVFIGVILIGIFGLIGKGKHKLFSILGIIFAVGFGLFFWYFLNSFLGLNFFGK
ncbi:MAG TPA: hypothetical protein VJI73_02365 [Candidatus Paceibacterota bacterium]